MGQEFEAGSNWAVLFWVCHEIEVEMLVVAVVIIWRLDWSWRIFFQMIHSHGCGQETVAPHHLDVFKGLSFPANIASGFLQSEWSKTVRSSRGSSRPRSPTLQVDSLPSEPPGKPKGQVVNILCFMGSCSTLLVYHRIKWMKSCGPIKLYSPKHIAGQMWPVSYALPALELEQHNMNSPPKL